MSIIYDSVLHKLRENTTVQGAYIAKGNVSTYQDLPDSSTVEPGWTYHIESGDWAGNEFYWTGSSWENLGPLFVASDYVTQSQLASSGFLNSTQVSGMIGSGVLTITSGGSSVTFNANQSANSTVVITEVHDPEILIMQGGVPKGSFTLNQAGSATIDLDAGGSGGGGDITSAEVETMISNALTTSVGDGQIVISQSGGSVLGSFTVNQSGGTTIALPEFPTMPVVGSAAITIYQGATSKGEFNVNATENGSVTLDEIPTVGSAVIKVYQGATSKGEFNVNATEGGSVTLDEIPTVGSAVIQIWQGTTSKGQFNVNATENGSVTLDAVPAVGSATLTIAQGGVSRGSFGANATVDSTINLDAPSPVMASGESITSVVEGPNISLGVSGGTMTISGLGGGIADLSKVVAWSSTIPASPVSGASVLLYTGPTSGTSRIHGVIYGYVHEEMIWPVDSGWQFSGSAHAPAVQGWNCNMSTGLFHALLGSSATVFGVDYPVYSATYVESGTSEGSAWAKSGTAYLYPIGSPESWEDKYTAWAIDSAFPIFEPEPWYMVPAAVLSASGTVPLALEETSSCFQPTGQLEWDSASFTMGWKYNSAIWSGWYPLTTSGGTSVVVSGSAVASMAAGSNVDMTFNNSGVLVVAASGGITYDGQTATEVAEGVNVSLGMSGSTLLISALQPTLPTVGSATLTITQGGVNKGSFNANATTDNSVDLDAPLPQPTYDGSAVSSFSAGTNVSMSRTEQGVLVISATDTSYPVIVSGATITSIAAGDNVTLGLNGGIVTISASGGGTPSPGQSVTWSGSTVSSIAEGANVSMSMVDGGLLISALQPTIPTVGSATITIYQGATSKGSFNVNATENGSITLESSPQVSASGSNITSIAAGDNVSLGVAGGVMTISALQPTVPTVGSATITIYQGATSKGEFNVNATENGSVTLDAPTQVIASGSNITSIAAGDNITLGVAGGVMTISAAAGGGGGSGLVVSGSSVTSMAAGSNVELTVNGSVVTVSESPEAITEIPAASSAYALSNGRFKHAPTAAVIYTLPTVTDATKSHEILIDVSFASTTSAAFVMSDATPVTPYQQPVISSGAYIRYICEYSPLQSAWGIMPIPLAHSELPSPVIVSGAVVSQIVAGTNVTLGMSSGTLTISASGGGGGGGGGITLQDARRQALIFG